MKKKTYNELHFNSNGGVVCGVQEAANAIYANRNDVVSYVHGVCCSAAYWIACSASKIVLCSETVFIGSIGVALQAMSKDPSIVTSGVNKLNATPEQVAKDVDELYKIFLDHVVKCRGLERSVLISFEGKEFIGQKAIDVGLADTLLGVESMEELQKENEQLKLQIAELMAQIEELKKPKVEVETEVSEPMAATHEKHRILALLSLDKGGVSKGVVIDAIAQGWDFNKTYIAIESNKANILTKKPIPVAQVPEGKMLAEMIAKGGNH